MDQRSLLGGGRERENIFPAQFLRFATLQLQNRFKQTAVLAVAVHSFAMTLHAAGNFFDL